MTAMKKSMSLLLGTASVLVTLSASAQSFSKPEDAIVYRQGAMEVIGGHFGQLSAMATGKAPFDARSAVAHADVVAYVSRLPWAGFVAGSDQGKTRAKPEVWQNSAKFKAGADKFQTEAAKLATAARAGNLDQLKQAFGETAKTCKACHDDFRSKQ